MTAAHRCPLNLESSGFFVREQILPPKRRKNLFYSPPTNQYNPNQIFLIGDGFGLFVFFEKFEDTHFRNGVVKRPESKPRGPRKPKLAKDKEDNYENH